jgi:hypothetical protein
MTGVPKGRSLAARKSDFGCSVNGHGTRSRRWRSGDRCTEGASGTGFTSGRYHLSGGQRMLFSRGQGSRSSSTGAFGTAAQTAMGQGLTRQTLATGLPRSSATAPGTKTPTRDSLRQAGEWSESGSTKTLKRPLSEFSKLGETSRAPLLRRVHGRTGDRMRDMTGPA